MGPVKQGPYTHPIMSGSEIPAFAHRKIFSLKSSVSFQEFQARESVGKHWQLQGHEPGPADCASRCLSPIAAWRPALRRRSARQPLAAATPSPARADTIEFPPPRAILRDVGK